MELTPITEIKEESLLKRQGTLWRDAIHKDWYFEGAFQKLLIVFCFLFTFGNLIYWGWRLLF